MAMENSKFKVGLFALCGLMTIGSIVGWTVKFKINRQRAILISDQPKASAAAATYNCDEKITIPASAYLPADFVDDGSGNGSVVTPTTLTPKPTNLFVTGFMVKVIIAPDQDILFQFQKPSNFGSSYSFYQQPFNILSWISDALVANAQAAAANPWIGQIQVYSGNTGTFISKEPFHLFTQSADVTTIADRATAPAPLTTGKFSLFYTFSCFPN